MSVLRLTPYELSFDTVVKAKVMAKNIYGNGPLSTANTTGAKIQNVPLQVKNLSRLVATNE